MLFAKILLTSWVLYLFSTIGEETLNGFPNNLWQRINEKWLDVNKLASGIAVVLVMLTLLYLLWKM